MRPLVQLMPIVILVFAFIGFAETQTHAGKPGRVIFTDAGEIIIDAVRRTATLNGHTLEDAAGVVDAAVLEGRLLVALADGVVLVYLPPAMDSESPPRLVQRVDGLGRDVRAIIVSEEAGRAMLLSAGSAEIFGIRAHSDQTREVHDVADYAFVDHTRYLDFIRNDQGGHDEPRALDVGPEIVGMATDRELLELYYPDRSYRVVSRSPLPQGVARVEALAYTGARWVLAGYGPDAQTVVLSAPAISGPWRDIGVDAIDRALAQGEELIAWLPGRFGVAEGRVHLAIRGERGALVSWPASSATLDESSVKVRWLDDR